MAVAKIYMLKTFSTCPPCTMAPARHSQTHLAGLRFCLILISDS